MIYFSIDQLRTQTFASSCKYIFQFTQEGKDEGVITKAFEDGMRIFNDANDDNDIIEDDLPSRSETLHFKQRHPSENDFAETDQRFDFRTEISRSDSPMKEELSLKDISMLRNPEESIKRENH